MYPSQQHYPPRSANTVLLNFTNYEGVYCLTDTLLSNRVTPVLAGGWGGVPHPVLAGGDWVPPPPTPGTGSPQGRDLGPVTGVPPERTWDQCKYYGMEMVYP